MNAPSLHVELRKYRALACALAVTLFVATALFVQFLHMDRARAERAISLRVAHAAANGEVRIARLIERLETIGRDHLLLGASDARLLVLARALELDETLVSLCAREGDALRLIVAPESGAATASGRCAADFPSTLTLLPHGDEDTLATELRIVPPASGGAALIELRMRDGSARELRATLSSTALLDQLVPGLSEPGSVGEGVCLSLFVDGSFERLACRGAERGGAVASPEAFATADTGALRLLEEIETVGLRWRLAVAPDLQALAGTITPLPFLMFGAALAIGALACVFAYLAADRNLLLEARANELRTRLEQLERLQERNVLLDQFAAMAAHDLQAPIRFVVSNAHLLVSELHELERPELSRMAEAQIEQGERMRALVLDLLEFCRAGQGELKITRVDTLALVNDEVRLLEAREEYATTRIIVGPLPNALACDAGMLAQVVRNLLGNAVKFSQGSPAPKVSISASRDAVHGAWTFRVRDNGPGVEEAHRDRIFRPFARLDAQAEGTGMGLAIVKKVIERHGGTVWIDSCVIEGSAFCFTIPGAMFVETPR